MCVPVYVHTHTHTRAQHLHHDTRIRSRPPPSAALDSCTFNKSAEIQLLRPLLRRGARQLSRTGNYLSPRQGGNRSFWEKVHACTHARTHTRTAPLRSPPWRCELLADCIMASWEQSRAPPGAVWTGQTFLLDLEFLSFLSFFLSFLLFSFSLTSTAAPASAGRFCRDTFLAGLPAAELRSGPAPSPVTLSPLTQPSGRRLRHSRRRSPGSWRGC